MSTRFETLDFFTMPAFLHGAPALAIAFLGAILCAISPYIFRKDLVDSGGHSIPPGPLFRYAFLRKYPERALQAWARKYGPLFSIWMGNQLFVVVSDPVIAKDLLVTNGAIFSGRNPYFIKNRTVLNGRSITASGHDDHWRRDRRIAMSIMTLKAIQGYAHVIDFEAHVLVQSLYRKTNSGIVPINPGDFCGRFALNNMLTISYATRTDSTEDALTERALAITTEFAEISGVWSNMVDFIEILQYIPSRKRARARALHDSIIEVYGAMIERVRARLDRGDDVPDCLVKTLIQTQDKENLDWEDACMLAAVFTLGGVHTTAGLLRWVIALMAEHPDIQRRAHAELDAVVGSETRPSAADEQRLPYIRAIIKECERVHPPFLMITPHKADQNFVYNGVFIPKDTTIVADVWAMHHDEKRYPEPFKFNPDRYLGDELSSAQSALLSNPMERDHWSFGAGRRFCPGVHVAEHSIFVAVANLLWAFKIESVPGEPLSFDEYDGRSGHTPLPYRVFFRPRHDDVSTLLEAEDDEKTLSVRA